MSLTTFSSAFRRLREEMDLIKTKRKALKMKNKMLIYILLFSLFLSISLQQLIAPTQKIDLDL